MYHFVYAIFYLFSLLPWRALYLLSNGVYHILYYWIGYRKQVVFSNLKIAFPEKNDEERVAIAKTFYRNFADTFIETIKLVSVSNKELRKRFSSNIEVMNELYASGQSVQLITGHFFNWEFANMGVALNSRYPFVVVYMPLANKVFDRVMHKLRSRFGTLLIPATAFRNHFHKYVGDQYALILVADQNPGVPGKAYWTNFFTKPAPFVRGPEVGARANNTAIVYADFYKTKRGHYRVDFELITTSPRDYEDGALTKLLVQKTEAAVRRRPDNYLWSHRRWKWEYDEEKYGHLMIKQQPGAS